MIRSLWFTTSNIWNEWWHRIGKSSFWIFSVLSVVNNWSSPSQDAVTDKIRTTPVRSVSSQYWSIERCRPNCIPWVFAQMCIPIIQKSKPSYHLWKKEWRKHNRTTLLNLICVTKPIDVHTNKTEKISEWHLTWRSNLPVRNTSRWVPLVNSQDPYTILSSVSHKTWC